MLTQRLLTVHEWLVDVPAPLTSHRVTDPRVGSSKQSTIVELAPAKQRFVCPLLVGLQSMTLS